MNALKKYDRKLSYRKLIDGSIEVLRQAEFDSRTKHSVKIFTNQYMGSFRGMVEKLKSMDSTRIDFFTPSIRKNIELRNKKNYDDRMHSDIANFIRNGSQFVG